MPIDLDILYTWGATHKKHEKNEIVFNENDLAKYYFQVISGSVRMFNATEDGKQFTQGIFYRNESFGEPPLFIDEIYPSSAITAQESIIIRINKEKFFKILDEHSELKDYFLKLLANRIFNKANTSKEIINQKPAFRIIAFLNHFKDKNLIVDKKRLLVPFTRQEIADFTGLRVETVIREVKKLETMKKLEIIEHKIYF
jgi:CRP/FNR family transcriptional regulator